LEFLIELRKRPVLFTTGIADDPDVKDIAALPSKV